MIEIVSLCYQPGKSEHKEPYRFNRIPVNTLNLIAGHGIEGDWKARRNPKRQLNIMSYETLEQLREEGFKTNPGEMGEQIVIRGLDVMSLTKGERLQIGDDAIIEITAERSPCEWLELIQGKPLEQAIKRVGMLAKVLDTGTIKVGDSIKVLQPEP